MWEWSHALLESFPRLTPFGKLLMLVLVALTIWAGRAAAMSGSGSSGGMSRAAKAMARPSVVGLERYAVKGLSSDRLEKCKKE